MKTLKKFILPILVLALSFQSCDDNDNNLKVQTETITDIAVNTNDLSILVDALQRTDLDATLDGSGSFTVLAPTNTAFQTFLEDNGFDSLDDVPTAVLKETLLNHVIQGEVRSNELTTGYTSTMATSVASGDPMSLYVNTDLNVVFNGVATVRTENIDASNGIIHIVDGVIALPTVVTFATADTDLNILVQALTRSDLNTDFVGTLSTAGTSGPAPFTVFAPDNDAFVSLLAELQVGNLAQVDGPTLEAALKKHVIAGSNVRSTQLENDSSVETFNGTNVTIDLDGQAKIIDPNDRISIIETVNIQANNGVLHKISRVILP